MSAEWWLVYAYPRALELCLLVFVVLAALEAKAAVRQLAGAGATRRGLLALGALFALAWAVRQFLIPHGPRVFFDELEHLQLAQTLARLGGYGEPLVAGPGYDVVASPPLWPAGWHVLLSLTFQAFSAKGEIASRLAVALGALCVPAAYGAGVLAFGAETAGLTAAFLAAFSPLALKYSACASLETCALFWSLTFLACLFYWDRRRSGRALALCALAGLYAANCRPETFYLPLTALFWLAPRGRWRPAKRLALALAAGAAAAAPAALGLVNKDILARVLGTGPGFWLTWRSNLAANAWWLANPRGQAWPVTALAAVGLMALGRAPRRRARLLAAMAAAALALVSAAKLGRFDLSWYPHVPDRYALTLCPMLFLLAGAGAARLLGRKRLKWPGRRAAAGAALALSVLAAAWRPAFLSLDDADFSQLRRLHAMIAAADDAPPGLYVLTWSPGFVRFRLNRPAVNAQFWLDNRKAFDAQVRAQGGSPERILFKDLWWGASWLPSSRVEAELHRRYRWRVLDSQDEADGGPFFYLLSPKKGPDGAG